MRLTDLEKSRWLAFPVMLATVSEAVEGVLRSAAADRERLLRGVRDAALGIIDRHPAPAALSADVWIEARRQLEHDLALVGLHSFKRVMEILVRYVDRYVAAMPIHEKLRAKDAPTIRRIGAIYTRYSCDARTFLRCSEV